MHWALFFLTLSTPPTTPMVTTCWPFSTLVSLPGALLTLPPRELNSCLPPHPGVFLLHLFTVSSPIRALATLDQHYRPVTMVTYVHDVPGPLSS